MITHSINNINFKLTVEPWEHHHPPLDSIDPIFGDEQIKCWQERQTTLVNSPEHVSHSDGGRSDDDSRDDAIRDKADLTECKDEIQRGKHVLSA